MCRVHVLLSAVVCVGAAPLTRPPRWHELTADYTHEAYRQHFPAKSTPMTPERKAVFEFNVAETLAHNDQAQNTWKKGINEFTDMTSEEFSARLSSPAAIASARASTREAGTQARKFIAPDSVDWRTKGVLTAVKDQGGCGSCWAFASTEMIETYAAMSTNPPELTDLSPQQLVACAPNPNDCGGVVRFLPTSYMVLSRVTGLHLFNIRFFMQGGCEGSVPELAFDYVKANGMTSEYIFPCELEPAERKAPKLLFDSAD